MFHYSLIMAAGSGNRLMPYTEVTPKALINVNGKPLISFTLNQLVGNIENIALTIGPNGQQLQDYSALKGINTFFNTSNKGNAWWIFNTSYQFLNEPVLVFPCDIISVIDLDFIYSSYLDANSPPCLLIPVRAIPDIEGDYIIGDSGIVSSLSRSNISSIYCSGIQVINPFKIKNAIKESEDFKQVWDSLIKLNMVHYAEIYPHTWYSINTAQQLRSYNNCLHHFTNK